MALGRAGRLALTICLLSLAILNPWSMLASADVHELAPAADGWVNAARQWRNYGSATQLRAEIGKSESYLRFDMTAWLGMRVRSLELRLNGISGDSAMLNAEETVTGWTERSLTYRTRPTLLAGSSVPASLVNGRAVFELSALFPGGVIDRAALSLRISNGAPSRFSFAARESAIPPSLALSVRNQAVAEGIAPVADAYATPAAPTGNFGTGAWLAVDGDPYSQAYLTFDLSAWSDAAVGVVELQLELRDSAGAGITVRRVDGAWGEADLTWRTRPVDGPIVATIARDAPAGPLAIDVTAAFPDHIINRPTLSLSVTTDNADGFLFASREGSIVPTLRLGPGGAPPTPTPTTAPTPTPAPTDPANQLLYFRGQGSEHGVGLSQYGARGRANAGQTYDQILAHYYSGTTLGTINAGQIVRVQLASSYAPTASAPARITARGGSWSSAAFVDELGQRRIFPDGSYVQLAPGPDGWMASVTDAAGGPLAAATTSDLLIEHVDAATRFEMKWRSSLTRYDLYRGDMRLLVNGSGVQAINVVLMDDYLKGVVPAEIPPLWALEAVKAQAVAARGYAAVRLNRDRPYDVVPTASNQVYGGVRLEHPRSNLAVDATANQVVIADGKVANTLFFTVAGGYTENNEFVWVSNRGKVVANPISYLRGVPDYDENGLAYDRYAPGFAWSTDSFTWTQLEAMLSRDTRTDVGRLRDIKFERGVSGRVYRVTVIGSERTVYVSGAVFKGVYNSARLSGDALGSTMFYLEPAP